METLKFYYNGQKEGEVIYNLDPLKKEKLETEVLSKMQPYMEFILANNGYCAANIKGNVGIAIITGSEEIFYAVSEGKFNNQLIVSF